MAGARGEIMSDPKKEYIEGVVAATHSVDPAAVDACMDCLESAYREGRGVFVIGNGGSGSNPLVLRDESGSVSATKTLAVVTVPSRSTRVS